MFGCNDLQKREERPEKQGHWFELSLCAPRVCIVAFEGSGIGSARSGAQLNQLLYTRDRATMRGGKASRVGARPGRTGDVELGLASPVEDIDIAAVVGTGTDQKKPRLTQDYSNGLASSSSSSAGLQILAIRDDSVEHEQEQQGNGHQQQQQQQEELKVDPPGRYQVLAITTTAVVFGLATWFSATAVRYEVA